MTCGCFSIGQSAMFCEHANEVPQMCPCAAGCYCKTRTCAALHTALGKDQDEEEARVNPQISREYTDGNGRKVVAVFTLRTNERCFERALQHLANKAMSAPTRQTTALHQAVHVAIKDAP